MEPWVMEERTIVLPSSPLSMQRSVASVLTNGAIYILGEGPSLVFSADYDPPNLAAGATTVKTITVAGAVFGDEVSGAFSLDTQGIVLSD
jgi:hypothetical protein